MKPTEVVVNLAATIRFAKDEEEGERRTPLLELFECLEVWQSKVNGKQPTDDAARSLMDAWGSVRGMTDLQRMLDGIADDSLEDFGSCLSIYSPGDTDVDVVDLTIEAITIRVNPKALQKALAPWT